MADPYAACPRGEEWIAQPRRTASCSTARTHRRARRSRARSDKKVRTTSRTKPENRYPWSISGRSERLVWNVCELAQNLQVGNQCIEFCEFARVAVEGPHICRCAIPLG